MKDKHDGHGFLAHICMDCLHDKYFALKAEVERLRTGLLTLSAWTTNSEQLTSEIAKLLAAAPPEGT